MQEVLTLEEAAQYLRVSKSTLRRYTNMGTIKSVRYGPRKDRRFLQTDLDAFLRRTHE